MKNVPTLVKYESYDYQKGNETFNIFSDNGTCNWITDLVEWAGDPVEWSR